MRKEKICNKCNDLFLTRGQICQKCYQKNYYIKNKEKISNKKKNYYSLNKAKIDLKSKSYCSNNKEKVKSKNRLHYSKNKETILKYQKSIRHTPKRKYCQAVKSAKDRNMIWAIDFSTYCSIISNPCYYCNKSLINFGGSSLDRVDNSIGYTATNVLPCCGTCNNIRNNFLTVEEMKVAMNAVVELRKGDLDGNKGR